MDIKYSDLINGVLLDNQDKIKLTVSETTVDKRYIKIGIKLGPGVTWWKAVYLDDDLIVERQNSHVDMTATVGYTEFLHNNLNFWKAKLAGAHTYMYTVVDAHENMKAGNEYLFEWQKD